jgi:hypothetical protein
MAKFPFFKSTFLDNVCRQFEARSKALKHHGKLTFETQQPDEFEWLTVNFTPFVGHYLIFQFLKGNQACVCVRSRSRKNRGKVLGELRDLVLIDNARMIIEAIENTISLSSQISSDGHPTHNNSLIMAVWSKVQMHVLTPHDEQ